MVEYLQNKIKPRMPSTPVRTVGAAVAIVAVAVVIVWALVWRAGPSPGPSGPAAVSPIKPVALNVTGLRRLAHLVPQPIFWVGPRTDYLYELTRQSNGNVYIRYLPPGADAGARGAKYLVIATYPVPKALEALEAVAHGRQINLKNGGIALVNAKDPKSVLLAFPGVNYQVEVFDPSPETALHLALSGGVRPTR